MFGGLLTIAVLQFRRIKDAGLFKSVWVNRLRDQKVGVPYGIALAAAGLVVYPDTAIWMAAKAF